MNSAAWGGDAAGEVVGVDVGFEDPLDGQVVIADIGDHGVGGAPRRPATPSRLLTAPAATITKS